MVPTTRRALLHGAAALLAGLAGCGGSAEFESSYPPETPENVATDPEHAVLRGQSSDPVAWFPSDRRDDGSSTDESSTDDPSDGGSTPPDRARAREVIPDEGTAASLRFANVDGAAAAREFVDATDFGAQTLYLESNPVGECYERVLCYVTWSADEIDTDYARVLRPYDAPCSQDRKQTVVHLIRIPDVLDPDQVSGYGSSYGGGPCHVPGRVREAANATADGEAVATTAGVETGASEHDGPRVSR